MIYCLRVIVMLAKYEERFYDNNAKIWAGKYRNLNNVVHWHREHEMIFVSRGRAVIGINSAVYRAEAGELFFCKSGDIHYIQSEEDCVLYMLIFDCAITKAITANYALTSPKALQECAEFQKMYAIVSREIQMKKPFYEQRSQAEILNYISLLFRNHKFGQYTEKGTTQTAVLYQRLLDYIDCHYSTVTFCEAADKMGFSRPYFSALFVKLSGTTFTKYLNTVKTSKALELLKHKKSTMAQVAEDCGFSSQRQFNRVFKELMGIAPRRVTADTRLEITPFKTFSERFDPTNANSILME